MLKREQLQEVALEVSKAMSLGSRNLEWGIIHIVEISRGGQSPMARFGELVPHETIAVLGNKLFGAIGGVSVDGGYNFPKPEDCTLLSASNQSVRRAGFEFLFSLLPYFLKYRRCFGELDNFQTEEILTKAFQTYWTEIAPISTPEEEWQKKYGRPLMQREYDVEQAISKRFLRKRKVEELISTETLSGTILKILSNIISQKDMVFAEVFVPIFSVYFFESAHECFDRLARMSLAHWHFKN